MKKLINILIMLFLSLVVALIALACKPTFKEDVELRRQIDSAYIATSFLVDPELCYNIEFYYRVMEEMEDGYNEQDLREMDSIVNIIKSQLNIK